MIEFGLEMQSLYHILTDCVRTPQKSPKWRYHDRVSIVLR